MARPVDTNLQDDAALQLAAGSDVRTAARRLGVAPGTIYRWRRDADFRGRIESYRRRLRARTLEHLAARAARAAESIDPAPPAAARGCLFTASSGLSTDSERHGEDFLARAGRLRRLTGARTMPRRCWCCGRRP